MNLIFPITRYRGGTGLGCGGTAEEGIRMEGCICSIEAKEALRRLWSRHFICGLVKQISRTKRFGHIVSFLHDDD